MDKSHKKVHGIRVIEAGRTGFEQKLRKDERVELVRARTPLDAIGELAAGDVGSPGDTAILIAPGALTLEEAEEFAQTVRAIDPNVRTIGVGETFKPLGGSGMFDALVAQDADMSILEAALTGKVVAAPATIGAGIDDEDDEADDEDNFSAPMTLVEDDDEAEDEADDVDEDEVASLLSEKTTETPEPIGLRTTSLVDEEEDEEEADSVAAFRMGSLVEDDEEAETPAPAPAPIAMAPMHAPTPAAPSARPAASATDLEADSEAIEVVLSGGDALGVCLKALRERLGGEAHFTAGATTENEPGSVVVRRGAATFGTLRAAGAPREELALAAAWLARWLALNEQVRTLRVAAYTDQLTGAYNRRYFDRYLERAVEEGRRKRRDVSLLMFDIDDFKSYNDSHGHAAGDEILVETVRLLRSVVRPGDRVCRVGGDEFAVIFSAEPRETQSRHPQSITRIALRFQKQICEHRFPKLGEEAQGTLTISGGMATFPWEAPDAEALCETADRLAMASKRQGKNVITFGPGAAEVCEVMGREAGSPPEPEPEAADPADSDLDLELPPGI